MKATGMFGLLASVSWQALTKDVQLPPQVLVAKVMVAASTPKKGTNMVSRWP